VTAQWLAEVADMHVMRDFKESARDRHERERAHLLPLSTRDFDTALVVYRHVNVEGYLTHRLNHYSVPWSFIGQVLPVRITDGEVFIYSVTLEEIAHLDRLAGAVQSKHLLEAQPVSEVSIASFKASTTRRLVMVASMAPHPRMALDGQTAWAAGGCAGGSGVLLLGTYPRAP